MANLFWQRVRLQGWYRNKGPDHAVDFWLGEPYRRSSITKNIDQECLVFRFIEKMELCLVIAVTSFKASVALGLEGENLGNVGVVLKP